MSYVWNQAPSNLQDWDDASKAAHYWELAQTHQDNANVWRGKYERLLQRVQEHECEEIS